MKLGEAAKRMMRRRVLWPRTLGDLAAPAMSGVNHPSRPGKCRVREPSISGVAFSVDRLAAARRGRRKRRAEQVKESAGLMTRAAAFAGISPRSGPRCLADVV